MPKQFDQQLPKMPKFSHLVPAILCKKKHRHEQNLRLPETKYGVKNIKLVPRHVAAFNHIVNWPEQNIVHPGYLHTIAFPLQLKLMLEDQFPFSILGLVHLRNIMQQHEPIEPHHELNIECHFGEIVHQNIGSLFTINTEFYVQKKCVLRAQHQYLKRQRCELKSSPLIEVKEVLPKPSKQETWLLKSALGRRYAACSGDYNPIHLHPLSARLFGFKQHIIHGMWLKSRVISALCQAQQAKLHSSFSCEVEFKKPLYLPNSVCFQQQAVELNLKKRMIEFKVVSELNNLPVEHMAGRFVS